MPAKVGQSVLRRCRLWFDSDGSEVQKAKDCQQIPVEKAKRQGLDAVAVLLTLHRQHKDVVWRVLEALADMADVQVCHPQHRSGF
jgi:hypothetical protein